MFRYSVLLLSVLIASACAGVDRTNVPEIPGGRIVGGENADIHQFPHQISMRYNGRHRCGGSIYSPTIIVSAAHCVVGVKANQLTIVAGATLLSQKNVAEIAVEKIIVHPGYRQINNDNDVAILVLADAFEFTAAIQPIALAVERPPMGSEVTVTGWGTLVEGGNIPDHLQQVNVNIVDNAQCKQAYSFMLTSRMLCAAVEKGGKDACQGDSGGPLIHKNQLLGIVSWGSGCARELYPGVYASVPQLHEWIKHTAAANTVSYEYSYL